VKQLSDAPFACVKEVRRVPALGHKPNFATPSRPANFCKNHRRFLKRRAVGKKSGIIWNKKFQEPAK
jgi:hypothetical protein